jgi:hypothetical protein
MRIASQVLRGFALASMAALLMASAASPTMAAGKKCGGSIGVGCAEGDYCKHPAGACKLIGGTGVCTIKPKICPHIVAPVCGCDGDTYGNACEAAREGVSILHSGKCKPK